MRSRRLYATRKTLSGSRKLAIVDIDDMELEGTVCGRGELIIDIRDMLYDILLRDRQTD